MNNAIVALVASTTPVPPQSGVNKSLTKLPPSCVPPPAHALVEQVKRPGFVDLNVEASID